LYQLGILFLEVFMGVSRTIGIKKLDVAVVVPGTPVPLSTDRLFVTDFEIYVVANTIYLGDDTVNNTWIPRFPGTYHQFKHGDGEFIGLGGNVGFDFSKLFLDGTNPGDSIIIQYIAGQR
jgi:hypothetical protein